MISLNFKGNNETFSNVLDAIEFLESEGASEDDINALVIEPVKIADAKLSTKKSIDASLEKSGINPREQLITTANATQLALLAVATMLEAIDKAGSLNDIKKAVQPLMPFSTSFLEAREAHDMPMDVIGLESVAQKVIHVSALSGAIVKKVVTPKSP